MILTHRAKADFCYFIVMYGNLIMVILVGNLSLLSNTSLS